MADVRLSRYFALSEFDVPQDVALEKGVVPALRRLCEEVLDPMRARWGMGIITSGYRSDAHNRAVGGARLSRHRGLFYASTPAADVRFARGTPEQWAAQAINMGVGGVGIYESHVHVDQRRGRARW